MSPLHREHGHRRSWSLRKKEDELMHRRNYSIRLPTSDDSARYRPAGRGYSIAASFRACDRNRKKLAYLCLACLSSFYVLYAFRLRFFTAEKVWPLPYQWGGGQTLVFRTEDLRRVWEWEVAAGHYPTRREIPAHIGFAEPLENPARPKWDPRVPRKPSSYGTATVGVGPARAYLTREREKEHGVPRRPVAGDIADMDVVMDHCDYSSGKYVRDCLRMLREGAGLVRAPRRDRLEDEEYIYVENTNATDDDAWIPYLKNGQNDKIHGKSGRESLWGREYEPPLRLPPLPHFKTQQTVCDEDDPRIYHMFWTGKFTDKPYMAILSFLYTQNLGLHLERGQTDPSVCRPQLWIWVNQDSASATDSTAQAEARLERRLRSNPWTSPFLHRRFRDLIHFKIWNTADQLDGVAELRDDWRKYQDDVLPSHVARRSEDSDSYALEHLQPSAAGAGQHPHPPRAPPLDVDFGDASDYDRPTVKLSDLVRFVLCHRYGGAYLDMDTLFLRDWEELWGWRGAFAYRWSRLDRYNTAVLRMHRNSALGSFLLRTAVRNQLDFHPIRITRYLKDAGMEGLLMRLPDALFDSAWLGAEGYQVERPAQPFFARLNEFFDTPPVAAAAAEAMGFDGFFKGAFSYHYHNNWWTPFDPERNFPDLGPVFSGGDEYDRGPTPPQALRDLSWSAVLKRTFEAYIRGETPNMYGEWLRW